MATVRPRASYSRIGRSDPDCLEEARRVASMQADDENIWFVPRHITEQYLQAELRRLHRAIEGDY